MWIVRYAWEKSFARIQTNKHAIPERGWGPLNYVLLDHPELKAIEDRVSLVTFRDDGDRYFPQENLNSLNITEGIAGDTIKLFLEEKARREELDGMDRAGRERRRQERSQKKLDMGKRLTDGIWAAAGNHCIDTECMAILRRQRENNRQKEVDKVRKEEEVKNKLLAQVRAVLANEKPPDQWSLEEWTCSRLKVMCMFYKNKDDKALPSRKNDMFERYKQTRHRRSLEAVTTGTSSSNNTSNIDSEGEGDGSDDDNEPLTFIETRKTNKARRTTTVTHQDYAMDTIDNESAAENDESSNEGFVMCDSESSDDDSLDLFPRLSGADDEYCNQK
jgi:hypothetical protein